MRIPIDASEIDAMHGHRQSIAVLELEPRPHVREWLRDALHGAAAQAGVALEARRERVRRDHAGEETGGGAAVGAIQRAARRPKSADSGAFDSHLVRKRRNRGAKGAKDLGGGADVLRVENPADARLAIRE